MNLKYFRAISARRAAVLFGSLWFLTICGCGVGVSGVDTTVHSAIPTSAPGTMSGVIHGGQFPIYNATVTLYAAGTTGYGTGAIPLATTTSDVNGNFMFNVLPAGSASSGASWGCPTSNPDPQIYITAVGGNSQGTGVTTTNNSAAALMAAIGPCSKVSNSTQVLLNELTTVATVFALAQYINPGSGPGGAQIGTNAANTTTLTGSTATVAQALSVQGAIGLNNAVAGIANLASVSTGGLIISNTYKGATALPNVAAVSVTATPESAKLVTIANILAACINSPSAGSSPCVDLFASASPPPSASVTSQPAASFAAAQDTIQAAYYMAVNPSSSGAFTSCSNGGATKIACLFNLASSTPPFQTGLTVAPTDWTIGVTYSSASNCAAGGAFMLAVYRESVDAYGNIWFMPNDSHTGALSAINSVGAPVYCAKGTIDTTSNYTAGFGNGLTIDTAGNIWSAWGTNIISTTVGEIYEAVSPGAVPSAASMTMSVYTSAILGLPTLTATTFSGTYSPTSIVADPYGNVFFSTNTDFQPNGLSTTGTALGMFVYEIPSGTTVSSTSPVATQVTTSTITAGTSDDVNATNFLVEGIADTVGRVYFVSNSYSNGILELTPPSTKITGYSISGGSIVFTGTNSFTSGQKVILSGLSTAEASTLNGQQLQLTAATSTTFTAATGLASIGATTDSGIAVVVPTGATSYNVVVNNLGNYKVYGAAVDNNNYVYTGYDCCTTGAPYDTLAKVAINPAGTAITAQTGNYSLTSQNLGGNVGIRSTVLDGADNVWFGNYAPSVDTTNATAENSNTGIWSIGELATSGGGSTAAFTALSPAPTGLPNGDTCASSSNAATGVSGCPVGGGFQKAAFAMTEGLAIDPSGNVWAGGYGVPIEQTAPSSPTPLTSITEIIGAGVPVVTPLSNAAANFKLATKP